MDNKKLLGLAKQKKVETPPEHLKNAKGAVKNLKKTPQKVIQEKPVEVDRDTKAKQTIEKLLGDFDPTTILKQKETEYDGDQVEEIESTDEGSIEWLEQQVSDLTEENDYLRLQLANLQNNGLADLISPNQYRNPDGIELMDSNSNIKEGVMGLFLELQKLYIDFGFDYNRTPPKSNLIINPEQFMLRMIHFIPFLEDLRKVPLQ